MLLLAAHAYNGGVWMIIIWPCCQQLPQLHGNSISIIWDYPFSILTSGSHTALLTWDLQELYLVKGSTGTRLALCCTAWIISDNLQSYVFSCSSFESGCGPWQKFGNLLHILRSRTNPIRCDRIWIECKILAASNAFCQLYILFVFLADHPGRWREASYLQISVSAKNIKNKTIL